MKFIVPRVSQEYTLDKNCRIELKVVYSNKQIIDYFKPNNDFSYSYGYGIKESESLDIVLKEGTKLKCTSIKHKYGQLFVYFKHIESKFTFIINSEELEELSFKTKEKILLKINWSGNYMAKGGMYRDDSKLKSKLNQNIYTGTVNGNECFNVILKSYKLKAGTQSWNRGYSYITDIEYTLIDVISDEEIGTWKTMATCRKKALEKVKNNKNKYFSKKQKQRMRAHKFNRL